MNRIAFEQRAVAYIDVLGFKDLVLRAASLDPSSLKKLQDLVILLSAVVPHLNRSVASSVPPRLTPEHLYVSDCIILSTPLEVDSQEYRNYNGLEVLAMRVIQVAQLLLDFGYLIRGGIAVGPVWHERTNVVGPAYQDAVELEQTAGMPRVVLSSEATRLWKSGGSQTGSRLCVDYGGAFIVNTLHDSYVPARFDGNISDAFARYTTVVQDNLNAGLEERFKQKWLWMQQFLEVEQKASFLGPVL